MISPSKARPVLAAVTAAIAMAFAGQALAAPAPNDADRQAARALLSELITIPTAKGRGQVPKLVDVLSARLRGAGFSAEDIVRVPIDIDGERTEGLIVRYRAAAPGPKRPVALLAHMDVVDVVPESWTTDPYKPVEKDGYLYGRGSTDNKFAVAVLVTTFARLKAAGWAPDRDLLLAFSGDEETGMLSTRKVIAHPLMKNVEYALNADAGGGTVTKDGKPVAFTMQAAEKTTATFELATANPGGHSSAPRPDNAIYDLADALKAVQAMPFPVELNEITRAMVIKMAKDEGDALGAALNRLLIDPTDAAAIAEAKRHPNYTNILWTTCVATMLRAGNAPNALPSSAVATVNCRILPGTPAAAVQSKIQAAVGDKVSIKLVGEAVESPISPVRPDILAALQKAVNANYKGAVLAPSLSSGGTEGREYRRAGVPTYGAGSLGLVFPDDLRAHGSNERIPLAAFDKELTYWDVLLKEIASDGR
ncbi:M20/M25/M40 family metallo-hydrolase [Caulobacter sp. NIBR2454]|uniref:M20/M25/M40 family metallo-hydrolase n=1 Tax=Caulobacter sp. NIBR2454 TaxID=3015996 RepID=UPI0022B66B85|nr:M20/M25/M40 family metallo-hydrolase [Caulobacter sp. NIBR2454]